MNCQKLSLVASTHAAQNERLPLRVIVKVLFFEQLRLRTSISGWFFVDNLENSQNPSGNLGLPAKKCCVRASGHCRRPNCGCRSSRHEETHFRASKGVFKHEKGAAEAGQDQEKLEHPSQKHHAAMDNKLMKTASTFLASDSEREQLCRLMNCQKLSLVASTHAAQNERLPLRVIVKVLFFEQLRLRTSISGWFFVDNLENSQNPSGNLGLPAKKCCVRASGHCRRPNCGCRSSRHEETHFRASKGVFKHEKGAAEAGQDQEKLEHPSQKVRF
ncbi:hypothetical protein C1H46_016895 [Malus baccata]|uniref:NPH3 domain-containing protein n=1 Tax=Malus baccata TaxID=106549 RepID=A0A540MFI7_MALBA|nr:hypothetical protein C1H46_016895 [Malus baccata]